LDLSFFYKGELVRSRTGGSLGFKNKISFYLIKVHRFLDHLLWRLMDGNPFYNFDIIGCFAYYSAVSCMVSRVNDFKFV